MIDHDVEPLDLFGERRADRRVIELRTNERGRVEPRGRRRRRADADRAACAGAIAVERGPSGTMGPSTHAYGGTRMGDNKETNTVDRWGFAHEVPNLGVLGASVMGSSGAHNPTLTAQDRKSTRLNSSHVSESRMPSSA